VVSAATSAVYMLCLDQRRRDLDAQIAAKEAIGESATADVGERDALTWALREVELRRLERPRLREEGGS